jgi:hypothetical protein
MNDFVSDLRDLLPTDIFTDSDIINSLDGSADRRYGLIKRALADGSLIPVRRGVYAFGKRFQRQPLNLFELAQKIYPFSYVSLESALSFHGWIPEAAFTVTSVSLKRSARFETQIGNFSYSRIPKLNLVAVDRVRDGNSIFLMASPVKALIDYVVVFKKDAAGGLIGSKLERMFRGFLGHRTSNLWSFGTGIFSCGILGKFSDDFESTA